MLLTNTQEAIAKKEVKAGVIASTMIFQMLAQDRSLSTEQRADRMLSVVDAMADAVVEAIVEKT